MRTVVGYSILPEELTPLLSMSSAIVIEGEEHQCGITSDNTS